MAGGLRDDMAGLGLGLGLGFGAPWGGRWECAQWLTLFVVAPALLVNLVLGLTTRRGLPKWGR